MESKWEIEPHPYDSDYDIFITNDDAKALQAILEAAETAWDSIEPDTEIIIKIRLNSPQEKPA